MPSTRLAHRSSGRAPAARRTPDCPGSDAMTHGDGGPGGASCRFSRTRNGSGGQEVINWKSSRTQSHRVAPELSWDDRDGAERHPQCLSRRDLANRWQELCFENLVDPASDDDSLGVEQVDEVGNAYAEIRCRLLQDRGSGLVTAGRLSDGDQTSNEVGLLARRFSLAQFVVASHDRPAANVCLQTPFGTASSPCTTGSLPCSTSPGTPTPTPRISSGAHPE